MAHKALGRGLDALFASTQSKKLDVQIETPRVPANEVKEIPLSNIKPNRHQPRTEFDPASLEELAQSIRSHGVAQPILVTETEAPGQFELVAGERRLRAAKIAGLATIPCTVKKMTNRQRFEVALVENLQRQDLNALEEAVALEGLMREYELTQDQVAAAIGKSRSTIANVLRLLRLHENVQGAVRSGAISEGHAKCLAGVQEHSEQLRLLEKIVKENLSVRDLEALLSETKTQKRVGTSKNGKTPLPEVKKYEEEFQRMLLRRVEMKTAGKKGWLRFEFYSPEDFELLTQQLGLIKKMEHSV